MAPPLHPIVQQLKLRRKKGDVLGAFHGDWTSAK
jgi:hypothetical protein